jgi:hypothetical protein
MPMVDWMQPGQLLRTGFKTLISSVFGSYADRRETIAALSPNAGSFDWSNRRELWIDYVADLGDGFDSTYSVARLMAQPSLTVSLDARDYLTQRGHLLILGGDQVYPTASYAEYRRRFVQPYHAALPRADDADPPAIFAIPGNHDWYDGLVNFSRVFCQKSWVGGRKTQQERSYFAVKLPFGWWLWGLDIQLEGRVDKPQLDYFSAVHQNVGRDDKVILATGQPTWIYAVTNGPGAFRSLAFFEDRYIRYPGSTVPRRTRLAVSLAGDLHNYSRFEQTAGQVQRITCGGGGSYLYPTNSLPETLSLSETLDGPPAAYTKRAVYPTARTSFVRSFGCLLLPARSWRFSAFLASLYTLFAWIVQSSSKAQNRICERGGRLEDNSFMECIHRIPFSPQGAADVAREFFAILAHSPASTLFCCAILASLVAFCPAKPLLVRIILGALHGLAHIGLAVSMIWFAAYVNVDLLKLEVDTVSQVLMFLLEMTLVGGILGSLVMAVYLLLSNLIGGLHENEVFACQRIKDFKCWLRLHIDSTGELTIYPIGIDRVCRRWRFSETAEPGAPWYEPKTALQAHLIEPPIRLK